MTCISPPRVTWNCTTIALLALKEGNSAFNLLYCCVILICYLYFSRGIERVEDGDALPPTPSSSKRKFNECEQNDAVVISSPANQLRSSGRNKGAEVVHQDTSQTASASKQKHAPLTSPRPHTHSNQNLCRVIVEGVQGTPHSNRCVMLIQAMCGSQLLCIYYF